MKYLIKYSNHSEYEENINNLIKPYVAYDYEHIHYNMDAKQRGYQIFYTTTDDHIIDGGILEELIDNVLVDNTYDGGQGIASYKYSILEITKITDSRDKLTSLGIPELVKTIGEYAIANCPNLVSLTIGKSVENVFTNSFESCDSLNSVTIYSNYITSSAYTSENTISQFFGNNITDYALESPVRKISDYCFYNCSDLLKISLPDTLETIGDNSFAYCSSLTDFKLPNTITKIGNWAFKDCHSLTEMSIPTGVTEIGVGTFGYCNSIETVYIPKSVIKINDKAFYECSNLSSINFEGTEEEWNAIEFGNKWDNGLPEYTINFNKISN